MVWFMACFFTSVCHCCWSTRSTPEWWTTQIWHRAETVIQFVIQLTKNKDNHFCIYSSYSESASLRQLLKYPPFVADAVILWLSFTVIWWCLSMNRRKTVYVQCWLHCEQRHFQCCNDNKFNWLVMWSLTWSEQSFIVSVLSDGKNSRYFLISNFYICIYISAFLCLYTCKLNIVYLWTVVLTKQDI